MPFYTDIISYIMSFAMIFQSVAPANGPKLPVVDSFRKDTYIENNWALMEDLELTIGPLDSYLFNEDCPEQGTIEKFVYEDPYYGRKKSMSVYLPYGYNEDTKYNVLFLMPGINGTAYDWFEQGTTSPYTNGLTGKTLIDNMIYAGDCEPLILVSVLCTGYNGASVPYRDEILSDEFRTTIMPFVLSNFSTYASPDGSDLEANRDHFGIAGLSMGAISALGCGMKYCSEFFSWFGAFSYGAYPNSLDEIIGRLNNEYSDLDINYLYVACGDDDFANRTNGICQSRVYSQDTYIRLLDETNGRFTEGENAIFTWIDGNHRWNTWHICLYNMLKLFFVDHSA